MQNSKHKPHHLAHCSPERNGCQLCHSIKFLSTISLTHLSHVQTQWAKHSDHLSECKGGLRWPQLSTQKWSGMENREEHWEREHEGKDSDPAFPIKSFGFNSNNVAVSTTVYCQTLVWSLEVTVGSELSRALFPVLSVNVIFMIYPHYCMTVQYCTNMMATVFILLVSQKCNQFWSRKSWCYKSKGRKRKHCLWNFIQLNMLRGVIKPKCI